MRWWSVWRRNGWPVVLAAAVCVACLVSGGARAWAAQAHPLSAAADAHAVVELEVRLAGEPRLIPARGHHDAMRAMPVDAESTHWRGGASGAAVPAVLLVDDESPWRALVVGSRFTVTARAGPTDPGDRATALLRPLAGPTVIAPAGPMLALVERLRAGLRQACAGLWPEARGLVPALVVGDVTALPSDLEEDFQTTGLTHLTAVSGSNLALLLSFVVVAASWCGVRGWWLRLLGLGTAIGFVFLCRAESSVVRAAAMGLVTLAALSSSARGGRGLRHLAVAVVALMLVDPWLSRSAGFALSVLASAGIVLWGRTWAEALWWVPRWVAEAVAVPLAAQVATQPVVTALSGQVTISGLVANAVAGPLVGPATVAGIIAIGLCWMPPLAAAAAVVAGVCATGIVVIAKAGASLPGASWEWPATPPALALATAAAAVLTMLAPALLRRRAVCAVLLLALVALTVRTPSQPAWPPARWAVVMCDVGQGDATLVRTGDGAAVVIDTGPDPVLLERCLSQLGIAQVPLLVLSHDHADHVGGLPALLRRDVGLAMLSGAPSANRPQLLAALAARAIPATIAAAGEELGVGEATWRTVSAPTAPAPMAAQTGESAAENDGSIIAVATSGGVSLLLTGDVEPGGAAAAVASGQPLAAAVLKVPHHGSARQDPGFLSASGARLALIGVGERNDYGHPAPKTMQALAQRGMRIARTDHHGAVAVVIKNGSLVVITQQGRP